MKKLKISLFIALILTISGCDFLETLTSEKTLLYGKWDVEKIYVNDTEVFYGVTTYSFQLQNDNTVLFQIWEKEPSANSTTIHVISSYSGEYDYSESDRSLKMTFRMSDEEGTLLTPVLDFKVIEITAKRLFVDVTQDETGLFEEGSVVDLKKDFY